MDRIKNKVKIKKMKIRQRVFFLWLVFLAAFTPAGDSGLAADSGSVLEQLARRYDLRPGPGVTGAFLLSRWHGRLADTPFDTPLYALDSGKPGLTALIIAGTHANEVAGPTAVRALMEWFSLSAGKLLLLPHANRSALEKRDTRVGMPLRYPIYASTPDRFLPIGDRHSHFRDQARDPEYFINVRDREAYAAQSSRSLRRPGYEARNLNRVYPGTADGFLTEQVAYAIIAMIKEQQVDLVLDMHEARTNVTYTDSRGRKITPFFCRIGFFPPQGDPDSHRHGRFAG